MRAFTRTHPLLLLLACSTDPTKGEETVPSGDSAVSPSETGEPSVDSPAETGEEPSEETGAESAPPEESGGAESGGAESGGAESGGAESGGAGETAEPEPTGGSIDACFSDIYADTAEPTPDYEPIGATIGSHCSGTDHQDITDIQRVVFVGDSITVGTPPNDPNLFYRSVLAENLSAEFGLDAPDWSWEWYDLFEGTAYEMNSGDFWSCAKWGARTDDLMEDNDQILDCMPVDYWDQTTLVVMTMGGNDLFNLVQGYSEGESLDELSAQAMEAADKLRDAVAYLKSPDNWGAPVHVIFANIYEFTDRTGDLGACPGADLAGLADALADRSFEAIVSEMEEEYLSIAVDTGADMTFLYENFCGHGYARDSADTPCYRGADAALWFDLTCIHPNDDGQVALADLFQDVIDE